MDTIDMSLSIYIQSHIMTNTVYDYQNKNVNHCSWRVLSNSPWLDGKHVQAFVFSFLHRCFRRFKSRFWLDQSQTLCLGCMFQGTAVLRGKQSPTFKQFGPVSFQICFCVIRSDNLLFLFSQSLLNALANFKDAVICFLLKVASGQPMVQSTVELQSFFSSTSWSIW